MKAIPSLLIASAVLLSACGGEKSDTRKDNWIKDGQSLAYSYPYDAQQQVPTPAPIVLRFTSPITASNPSNAITLYTGNGQSGDEVAYTLKTVDNGMGVIITPNEDLSPLSAYTIAVHNLKLQKGTAHDAEIRFTTAPLHEGARSEIAATGPFKIVNQIPDGARLPVMDFSSIRLQLSQPVDTDTLDGITLKAGANDVPAHILVNGPYITVDPKDDLTAGQSYTLSLSGLKSTLGETLANTSITLTPKDSKPRATMVQQVSDSNQRSILSPLTGMPINLVPMESVLLGKDNATQQTGDVHAELAFVPKYPDVTPLRISRGSLLKGSAIDVKIGGKVPAGFNSGDVTITFLSDANGYLMPNPFNGSPEAPRQVRLFMDVALSAADSRANGAVTQDILHVELVGTAIVKQGQMVINAVGVVEPSVLGIERAKGVLSFYMKSYTDQSNPPQKATDLIAPTLQSWTPGPVPQNVRLQDPIVLNFSEPLDPQSIRSSINLKENGNIKPFSIKIDGASVIITPKSPLKYSTATQPMNYSIELGGGIKDIAGNAFSTYTIPFSTPKKIISRIGEFSGEQPALYRPAVVLSTYPGFPCVTNPSTRNLTAGISGRCLGSKITDDLMPIDSLPKNRPIVVNFTKNIAPASITLGGSFLVSEVSTSGAVISNINGLITKGLRSITFTPDTPWESGKLYRYTLASNGDMNSSNVVCDGSESICDEDGLPLQTQLQGELSYSPLDPETAPGMGIPIILSERTILTPPNDQGGGKNMEIFFRAVEASPNILQSMQSTPLSDTNGNMIHEGEAPPMFPTSLALSERYTYPAMESGASNIQDPDSNPILDPDGLMPPPNSAKILAIKESEKPETFTDVYRLIINQGSIGCGYSDFAMGDFIPALSDYFWISTRGVCPKHKFIYLNSSLQAEVTSITDPIKGVMVKVWPSLITGTGIAFHARVGAVSPLAFEINSGPQILRMRYAKDSNGVRNQPLTAWIKTGPSGKPQLELEGVEIYLTVPWLQKDLGAVITGSLDHTLISYPITMNLSGEVKFLDDGRMVVDQYNVTAIPIDISIYRGDGTLAGELTAEIPKKGTRLQYISKSVK